MLASWKKRLAILLALLFTLLVAQQSAGLPIEGRRLIGFAALLILFLVAVDGIVHGLKVGRAVRRVE